MTTCNLEPSYLKESLSTLEERLTCEMSKLAELKDLHKKVVAQRLHGHSHREKHVREMIRLHPETMAKLAKLAKLEWFEES